MRTSSGEHGVEGGGELGVAVPDEEPEVAASVVEVHEQVAGLLGQPDSGALSGDTEDVHAAGACSMTQKIYSRRRVMVSRWSKSQPRIACACAFENSALWIPRTWSRPVTWRYSWWEAAGPVWSQWPD